MIDADRLRGFLDCMHEEADERDKKSKAISDIVKAAKEVGYDTKAVRKVFARERMDEAERAKQDNLLESYEHALGAKGRALGDIRRGVPVGEAATRHGVHRATLARSRNVAKQTSNATEHDPETGEGLASPEPDSSSELTLTHERASSEDITTKPPKPEDGDDGITESTAGPDEGAVRSSAPPNNAPQVDRTDEPTTTPVPEGGEGTGTHSNEAPATPSVGAVARPSSDERVAHSTDAEALAALDDSHASFQSALRRRQTQEAGV